MRIRKSRGSFSDGLISLIFIVAVIIIVQSFIYMLDSFETKEDIRQYARSCMLDMESAGCLTPESEAELIQKLSDLQATDIDLSGTTLVNAGYGADIYLCINCRIPMKTLDTSGNGLMSFVFSDSRTNVSIKLMSTAKN